MLEAGLNCNCGRVSGYSRFTSPCLGIDCDHRESTDGTGCREGHLEEKEFVVCHSSIHWEGAASTESVIWRVQLLDSWHGSRLSRLLNLSNASTDSVTEFTLQETICVCSGFCFLRGRGFSDQPLSYAQWLHGYVSHDKLRNWHPGSCEII